MRKFTYYIFFMIITIVTLSVNMHAQRDITIGDINITWRNFIKKDTPRNQLSAAKTAVRSNIQLERVNDEVTIDIQLMHSRNESWVSKQFLREARDQESIDLLNHEKIHYAINILYFKMLYEELTKLKITSDYTSEITGVFNRVNLLAERRNAEYDRITQHGTKKEEQYIWEAKILQEINQVYKIDEWLQTNYTIKKQIK